MSPELRLVLSDLYAELGNAVAEVEPGGERFMGLTEARWMMSRQDLADYVRRCYRTAQDKALDGHR